MEFVKKVEDIDSSIKKKLFATIIIVFFVLGIGGIVFNILSYSKSVNQNINLTSELSVLTQYNNILQNNMYTDSNTQKVINDIAEITEYAKNIVPYKNSDLNSIISLAANYKDLDQNQRQDFLNSVKNNLTSLQNAKSSINETSSFGVILLVISGIGLIITILLMLKVGLE